MKDVHQVAARCALALNSVYSPSGVSIPLFIRRVLMAL